MLPSIQFLPKSPGFWSFGVESSARGPLLSNVTVKSKLQHAPPPQAFDIFAVPGRREFDYQSLPGGGKFDPHVLGVGNLNCTHDFI